MDDRKKAVLMRGPEARIAVCKCGEAKKTYGVRFERFGEGWKSTWAFPLEESSARRQGYEDTELKGNLFLDNKYPGCPYCHTRSFIVCDDCHKLNCNIGDSELFTCEWCGIEGVLSDYEGSGVAAGGDRG